MTNENTQYIPLANLILSSLGLPFSMSQRGSQEQVPAQFPLRLLLSPGDKTAQAMGKVIPRGNVTHRLPVWCR